MNKKYIFTLFFFSLFSFFLLYLSGIVGLLEMLLSLLIYLLIAYGLCAIWKKMRKKSLLSFVDFIPLFFYKIASLLTLTIAIIGSFCFYANEISPAAMPRFTLSNGAKQVEFQAMVHIGKESFYQKVQDFIRNEKQNGAVLFYEGVLPGTPENSKKFNEAIGVEFDRDLYKNFSKLYGVTFQENERFLGLVNNLDFNVDMTMDEIMALYQQKETSNQGKLPSEVMDANKLIVEQLSLLNERQLQLLVYINQAILNTLIKSDGVQDMLISKVGNKALFDVILNGRNEVIVDEISTSSYNRIVVTYGLLHFKGVLEGLQKRDPNWKVIKTEYLYPISSKN